MVPRDRGATLASAAAKLKSDLEHLEASCLKELAWRPRRCALMRRLRISRGEELCRRGRRPQMRQRLEAMGPVNMMALEEYKETAERHSFP
jgi:chromosome segregation protein